MASGSRHSLRYVAETVRGTTPATPAFETLRHTGTTLGLSKEALQSEEMRSDRMIADIRHGAYSVAGDINFELSYESFDEMLEALLGGSWTTNVLKAGTLRRFFTFERFFGDIQSADKPYHRFTGVELNTMQLQVNANAMVTGAFGVIGKSMSTATTAIAGATYPAVGTAPPMDSFTGTLLENGIAIAVITEIALTLENGLETRYVVGDKASIEPSIGRSNVNGTITAFFENSTLLDKFINETESSIEFNIAGSGTQNLQFQLPRIKYMGGQPDVSGEGPITLAMPFQALLSTADASNIIITRTP